MRGQRFYRQLLDRLNELPQVRSAALGTHKSLVGWVPTTEVFLPRAGRNGKRRFGQRACESSLGRLLRDSEYPRPRRARLHLARR